jgi:hypothetical protein
MSNIEAAGQNPGRSGIWERFPVGQGAVREKEKKDNHRGHREHRGKLNHAKARSRGEEI